MSHSSEGLKFTAQDFANISDNPLLDYTHIFQYFSDWIDSIQASTGGDTWRPIQVNGVEQKGSSISSGYINFGSDSNHNVVFSYGNNTIMANARAIEDVIELPTGSAIDENKFYRLTTIGEEVIVPIPGDDTAFSNIVFNTDLSVDEVKSIVTNINIAYTDIPADQSPISVAFKMYDINGGDYQKKYQYTIIGIPDLDLALICNQVMIESMSSGSQTGDEQVIWTNNGNVLAELLQLGTSLPDGGDPMGTGILIDPIAPIYFLNNDVETYESNGLLKNLVYCTKITDTLKIKEIYEDNVADTAHTQYIKSNLGTLKLNVVNTMPTTIDAALHLIYAGMADYTIGVTPNDNHAIVALFVENTNTTTVAPYLFAALIDESDLDNPSINASYAAIGPAGTIIGRFSGETYGTITLDVEPIKSIVLYHHKDDTWYDVGSGLDPRFVVGTTAEISAMSDDELQGKVVILTDETENYKSTLEAIQEQVSSAMVNVAHISDIPQLEINGVATNRINIQTGITDGFAKTISGTNDDGVQSGQASADSNNNIDITNLINDLTAIPYKNGNGQLLTASDTTNTFIQNASKYNYIYSGIGLYEGSANAVLTNMNVSNALNESHFDGELGNIYFQLSDDEGINGRPVGRRGHAINEDVWDYTPAQITADASTVLQPVSEHASGLTNDLFLNGSGTLALYPNAILRNDYAGTDYHYLVSNYQGIINMSPWFSNLPNVVTAAGQTLGANTIVLGSGSQKVKSSNYTITSNASHITGSASAAANEVPTAAAVHQAMTTMNNLHATYSSGILTLTIE